MGKHQNISSLRAEMTTILAINVGTADIGDGELLSLRPSQILALDKALRLNNDITQESPCNQNFKTKFENFQSKVSLDQFALQSSSKRTFYIEVN